MNELVMFDDNSVDNLPAHLQGGGLGATQSLMAIIGDQLNRIGVKGSRFRQFVAGTEVGIWEENYLDVIIVGVVESLSRIYYAGAYKKAGDNDPPTCYSVDNVAPPIDLATRQSDACATCQWDVKGSKVSEDGTETKACGYFRRLIVMLPGDPALYRLDVKSQGLFAKSKEDVRKYSLNDYAKFLNARGVDASILVTRLSFDTDSSTPKLFFSPNRYITPEEKNHVDSVANTKTLEEYLRIHFKTVDLSKETPAPEEDAPAAEAPKPTPAAQQPKPVAQTPKPVTQAPKPVAQASKPVTKVQVDSNVKPAPQQPKPVTQAPKPVTQTPKPVAQTTPVQEVIAEVQEVGSADELDNLIAELGI